MDTGPKDSQPPREGVLPDAHGYVFLDCGGPMLKISVGGIIYKFEMHPHCGPHILNRKGEPIEKQPKEFLRAASLWAQQGGRMEGGLCRWDQPLETIAEQIGRRHNATAQAAPTQDQPDTTK